MNVVAVKNSVDLIGGQPEFPLNVTNGNSKIHYINGYNGTKRTSDMAVQIYYHI